MVGSMVHVGKIPHVGSTVGMIRPCIWCMRPGVAPSCHSKLDTVNKVPPTNPNKIIYQSHHRSNQRFAPVCLGVKTYATRHLELNTRFLSVFRSWQQHLSNVVSISSKWVHALLKSRKVMFDHFQSYHNVGALRISYYNRRMSKFAQCLSKRERTHEALARLRRHRCTCHLPDSQTLARMQRTVPHDDPFHAPSPFLSPEPWLLRSARLPFRVGDSSVVASSDPIALN